MGQKKKTEIASQDGHGIKNQVISRPSSAK